MSIFNIALKNVWIIVYCFFFLDKRMTDWTNRLANIYAMYQFRYGLKISHQYLNNRNLTAVYQIVVPHQPLVYPALFQTPCRAVGSSNVISSYRVFSQYLQTSDKKLPFSTPICRKLSTRAASGSDSPESGMGPGPGPGPRRFLPDHGKQDELASQRLEPSDGSPSKCLEEGYGKPLKPPRRSFLNFCKRLVRLKEKPSNCPPCPPAEPEESFWDYLFKFEEKTFPEPSTCRIAHRHREACRKTDPRLSDPRYRRTKGDVLIFTEPLQPSRCTSEEPQPKSPTSHPLPKAVMCRRLVEAASLPCAAFVETEDEVKVDQTRCFDPRHVRIPFEECRPTRRLRESFSCEKGAFGTRVAPPMAMDRSTCGGRSVGEILAEATISQTKSSISQGEVNAKCEPAVAIKNSSRLQRLQQLTKAANCGKELSKSMVQPPSSDKPTRKMSTEAHS